MFNVKFAHAFEKIDSPAYIVLVIFEWFLDGFADGFESGKMDNRVKMRAIENGF